MSRFNNPVPDYTNNSGTLLANGLLYFYESGTNTTKITYADVNETIANTQPLVLNGDGSVPNCFFSGSAKVILADADGVQQWERDPVTATESSSFGETWDSVSIYSLNEVVTFNGILYVSITASNQNNNPSSVPAAWTQFDLLKRWNASETYAARDPVIATDYSIYVSLSNGNIGNNPNTDGGVNWQATGLGASTVIPFVDWDLSTNYGVGGKNIVTGSDGSYYVSLQTPNLNKDPISEPTFWALSEFNTNGLIPATALSNSIGASTTLAATERAATVYATTGTQGQVTLSDSDTETSTALAATIAAVTRRARLAAAETISAIWTFTNQIYMANSVAIWGKETGGGTPRIMAFMDGGNNVVLGSVSNPTRIDSNGEVVLANHSGATAGVLQKLVPVATGFVDIGGTLLDNYQLSGASITGLGEYTVTLTTPVSSVTAAIVDVNVVNTIFRACVYSMPNTSTIIVKVFDSALAPSSSTFNLSVKDLGN